MCSVRIDRSVCGSSSCHTCFSRVSPVETTALYEMIDHSESESDREFTVTGSPPYILVYDLVAVRIPLLARGLAHKLTNTTKISVATTNESAPFQSVCSSELTFADPSEILESGFGIGRRRTSRRVRTTAAQPCYHTV
jgi:hypothetical protein